MLRKTAVSAQLYCLQGRIMSAAAALYRSVLYIPASKERALDKARGLNCDAIIFDLEDAVTPEEKTSAREILARELKNGGYGHRQRIVRINALDTEWGRDDARAVANMECDAVLLPKVDGPDDTEALAAITGGLAIWCMLETPRGVLNALSIADYVTVKGFILGTNDLAKDIGCATGSDRLPLMTALQICLMAARAAGIVCVDGVYNAFKDDAGLEAECEHGRALGMDGKTLIHPAQLAIANRVFAPTPQQIDLARRQIEAFDAARAQGEGVAVVDGKIVENLHIETARTALARADAIAARTLKT
jgi:(3S)-malyl-CoA thioesterase